MIRLASIRSLITQRIGLEETDMTVSRFFSSLDASPERALVFEQLWEIGELKAFIEHPAFSLEALSSFLDQLIPIHAFYKEMGGIAGYHKKILALLQKKEREKEDGSLLYHAPKGIDISKMDSFTEQAVSWGIACLPEMAEIYPLGGAADRLHLVDPLTGLELPAAKLRFAGISLLERLILDVQAREYLYYQVYGKQLVTPIVIMTSWEKGNHFHIETMLEENRWFGRPKDSFRIFTQPLVPVVGEKGNWLFSDDLKPVLKPGGHGALWKLANDHEVFAWLESLGRKKALVRQINNPIAGLDYGLLAFIGIGSKRNYKFGFASCPRLLHAAEGVNVLIEKQNTLVLTNIEYCDFAKFGIEDLPLVEGDPYSRFSSNTNLLFADLASVKKAVEKSPFPGLLLNLKKGTFINAKGQKGEAVLGRLESTMQNIADVFVEEKQDSLMTLETFITYNERHKTISTAKKAFVEGGLNQETPELCFYDFLYAARDLLENHCDFRLPPRRTFLAYLEEGPEFVFLYHPSLGPLYSLIREKLLRGTIALGSELHLWASHVSIADLDLEGSLRVIADPVVGKLEDGGFLRYTREMASCVLKNVKIVNRGVSWGSSSPFWRGDFARNETVEILLKGKARFEAENITFRGSHRFVVEEGVSMRVYERQGEICVDKTALPDRFL